MVMFAMFNERQTVRSETYWPEDVKCLNWRRKQNKHDVKNSLGTLHLRFRCLHIYHMIYHAKEHAIVIVIYFLVRRS